MGIRTFLSLSALSAELRYSIPARFRSRKAVLRADSGILTVGSFRFTRSDSAENVNKSGYPRFEGDGGEKGDRTLDLRLMSPALYQLSYLAKVRRGRQVHMIPNPLPDCQPASGGKRKATECCAG